MTTVYNIEVLLTKTHIKVTYRNKKFKKLEHIKGNLDEAMLKQIGRIIPHHEDHLNTFKTTFKNKIAFTKIIKEKSTYSNFLGAWYAFYNGYMSMDPKFTGADGNALKAIIKYLKELHGGDETKALELWKIILEKWETLSEFHKSNTDLKYINSQLNKILINVKASSKSNAEVFKSAMDSQTARDFKFK